MFMTAGPRKGLAWLEDMQKNEIPIHGSCSIGRSASNQISLESDKVSRRHAIIQAQSDKDFWLIDLGSSNGTYLNAQRISNPRRLQHGDKISIGHCEFVFQMSEFQPVRPPETSLSDRTLADIRPAHCWLLVADIVSSTQLFKELSPEEVPILTGRWLAECKRTVEEHGGSINQFLGDGFFAYWRDRVGVQVSIAEALRSLHLLQEKGRPDFRMVAHYGEVVLGGVSLGEEERISGEDVHFTFRMEKLAAELGEVRLVSEAARKQLSPLIQTKIVGEYALPGFESKVRLYSF